jgi:hypothetical protein
MNYAEERLNELLDQDRRMHDNLVTKIRDTEAELEMLHMRLEQKKHQVNFLVETLAMARDL